MCTYIETLLADVQAVSAARACRQDPSPRWDTSWHPALWHGRPGPLRSPHCRYPAVQPHPPYQPATVIGRRRRPDKSHHAHQPIPSPETVYTHPSIDRTIFTFPQHRY